MSKSVRILSVTAGLVLAGAVTGAASGVAALELAALVLLQELTPLSWAAVATVIGAAFGALIAPTLSFVALRNVPIGRAVGWIAVGSGIGGAIGVILGATSVNPYAPLAIDLPPVPQGLLGALGGAALAATYAKVTTRSA